ncbi:MAG: zinc ribbon domain-containing protein [Dehalococcoidia bacterium]|nr:zinc ribbon domain-containing protein [Dehalococcoidia bacterium]
MSLPQELLVVIQVTVAMIVAYAVALWFSLLVWTYRDIRARSKDLLVHLFSVIIVTAFNLPGLLMYLALRPRETLADRYDRALEEETLLRDLEERLACPRCKRLAQADFIICPYCRASLRQPCPGCGKSLDLEWKACPYCTIAVSAAELSVSAEGSGRRADPGAQNELYQPGNAAGL